MLIYPVLRLFFLWRLVPQCNTAATIPVAHWTTAPTTPHVPDIKPWNSSSITHDTPQTWIVSGQEELNALLGQSHYQRDQWAVLKDLKLPAPNDWSNWTRCSSCLSGDSSNTFQLRKKNDIPGLNASSPLIEARICSPLVPKCPEVTSKGYWRYDIQLAEHMLEMPRLPVSESYNKTHGAQYFIDECSMTVQRVNLKYAVLTTTACYGSNSSEIFRGGLAHSVSESRGMEVFIFPECDENHCVLIKETGLCFCEHVYQNVNQTTALRLCYRYRHFILPKMFLQLVMDFTDDSTNPLIQKILGPVWVSSMDGDDLTYGCAHVFNNSISDCDAGVTTRMVFCAYKDPQQFGWQPWRVQSTCTEACGGGKQDDVRYKLLPSTAYFGNQTYEPLKDQRVVTCNEAPCPWSAANASSVIATRYPKWAGCWHGLGHLFQHFDNDSRLDGDESDRLEPMEKCAVASNSNAFAIRKRLCYVANITTTTDYTTTPSNDCAQFGSALGAGFDVYRYSLAELAPQFGPWTVSDSSCSAACGGGKKLHARACNNPSAPASEGSTTSDCEGIRSKSEMCNPIKCPSQLSYTHTGCYSTSGVSLSETTDGLLDSNSDERRHDAIRKCALVAYLRNRTVFGLISENKCVMGKKLTCSHKSLPVATSCIDRMGGDHAISVYKSKTEFPLLEDCDRGRHTTAITPSTTLSLHMQLDQILRYASINGTVAHEVLNRLRKFFTADSVVTTSIISAVTEILEALADKLIVADAEEAKVLIGHSASTIDTLTQEQYSDVWAESQLYTSVLGSMETLVIKSSAEITTSVNETHRQRVALMAYPLEVKEYIDSGYKLDASSQNVEISLPAEAIALTSNQTAPLAVIIYSNISHFVGQPVIAGGEGLEGAARNRTETRLSNTVVTLKLASLSSSTRLSTDSIRVRIPVDVGANTSSVTRTVNLTCVFWNSTSKVWSSEGCTTTRVGDKSADCDCNHMTSFAVLMRITDYEHGKEEGLALTILSYVGCGVSLLCLIISFIIFIYLDNLKSERKKIHMNLIVALGLAQITHLVGIDMTYDVISCKCIAILLHLFYLSTFTWMLCEGIHLYHKIIAVFESEGKKKKIFYYCLGWGAPVIIVAVSAGIRNEGYGSEKFCWLSITDGLIWAFVGPVCLVIFINFIIMVLVIRVVVRSATAVVPPEKKKVQTVKAGVKSLLILTPLLGVNWLFGLLAVNKELIVFEFLFVIINSLQGLLIFIFHCVGSSEVRSAFLRKREIATRSFDRSSEDRSKAKHRFHNWLLPSNKKIKNWPLGFSTSKESSSDAKPEDSNNSDNIVGSMLDGRIGRNLGGLKHMVSPTLHNRRLEGVTNPSFTGDSSSSLFDDRNSPDSEGKHKLSICTMSTTLDDPDSRQSSEASIHKEETVPHRGSSLLPTSHNLKSERSTPPSATASKGGKSGDSANLEDIEEFALW